MVETSWACKCQVSPIRRFCQTEHCTTKHQRQCGYDPAGEVYTPKTQDPLKPNDDSLIYDGSGVAVALDAVQTPLLVTAIYEKDPSTILAGDVAGHMANLVSFDYDYLRMTTDHEYAAEYKSKWNQFEVNQVYMKPILITTGAVMAGAGVFMMATGVGFAAGLPLYIFGLDMICTNAFGKSFIERGLAHSLDFTLHNAPMFQYQNLSWIEGENFEAFSFYHFHSNHLVNIILVQLTFMMLGGVFSGFAGLRGVVAKVMTPIKGMGHQVSLMAQLGSMTTRQLVTIAARWAARLAIHLSCGVVFMALGAMRNSWGDGGVAAELLIQGLIIATVILRTRQAFIAKNTIPEMQAAEGAMDMQFMEENRPWWAEHALGNIYELWKLFSAKGSIVQAFKAATSVEFACDCLELAVTLGGGFAG